MIVGPYNSVLAFDELTQYSDLTFIMDNESLCKNMENPSFDDINKKVAHIVSSVTAVNRYQGKCSPFVER